MDTLPKRTSVSSDPSDVRTPLPGTLRQTIRGTTVLGTGYETGQRSREVRGSCVKSKSRVDTSGKEVHGYS